MLANAAAVPRPLAHRRAITDAKVVVHAQCSTEAIRRLFVRPGRGDDVLDLAAAIEELHPRHDTFPGAVYVRMPVIPSPARHCEKYLGECKFQRRENRNIQFAILASASPRGGIQPDLLGEVAWWEADDFWPYAVAAAVAVIRACRQDESIGAGVRSPVVSIAERSPRGRAV